MAENKKTIVVYSDWMELFESLSDDEAGKLIKHFFRYVNDLNPIAPDRMTEISFIHIKNALKRDLEKWEAIRKKRSQAGKLSAEKRKQKPTNSTSVESVQQKPTNSTVSVNVNDNVNNKVYNYTLEREILNSIASLFDNKYYNTESKKQKWLDEIRKLISIDGEDKETIVNVIKFARSDEFWSSNLLSINSLRNKNKSGVTKYDQIKAKMPNSCKSKLSGYLLLTEKEKQERNVNIDWIYIHYNKEYKRVIQDEKGQYVFVGKERVYL